MPKKLKIACLGAGYFSQFHYEAWQRLPQIELVGVVDRNIAAAQSCAKQYHIPHAESDLACLLEKTKPDLLDIITPPNTHLSMVKIAAQYGVNVVCQKPFGESFQNAQEMVAIAQSAGITLIVHENFRFMAWYRKIKSLLATEVCGQVLDVNFHLRPGDGQGNEAYLTLQPYFQSMEKFLVHETAIHFIDTFRYLFGEVSSVYADLRRCNPVIKGEDAGVIIFDFDNNLRATFNGNRLLDHAATNPRRTMGELLIEGTKGTLRLDGEARIWLRPFGALTENRIPYAWNDHHFGGDCVIQTIQHIVSHFLHNTPLENSGSDYLTNVRIENAIYQSAREQRKIFCEPT